MPVHIRDHFKEEEMHTMNNKLTTTTIISHIHMQTPIMKVEALTRARVTMEGIRMEVAVTIEAKDRHRVVHIINKEDIKTAQTIINTKMPRNIKMNIIKK